MDCNSKAFDRIYVEIKRVMLLNRLQFIDQIIYLYTLIIIPEIKILHS